MARFGQQFIRGLTSPEYSQGMFELGARVGSAPAMAAEKEQQSTARQLINEAIASNDPTKIMQASQAVSKTMPEMSTKLAQMSGQLSQDRRARQMAALEQAGLDITAQAEQSRNELTARQYRQGSALEQARILQQEGERTGNISLVDQGLQQEKQVLQEGATQSIQALVTQIANPETSQDLVKESRKTAINLARQNNVPEDVVTQALDAAEKQRLTAEYSTEVPKIKAMSLDAQKMISSGMEKDAFVSRYGAEYGFVFDTIDAEIKQTEEALQKAKENARLSKYQYSDEQLAELGVSAADIEKINALPSGRAKNAAVVNVLANKKVNAPNATLIKFYADSFISNIMDENNWDYSDEDEFKEAQALADKKARQLFLSNQGDPSAMANSVVESRSDAQEEPDMDIDAAIQELARSLTDGS